MLVQRFALSERFWLYFELNEMIPDVTRDVRGQCSCRWRYW